MDRTQIESIAETLKQYSQAAEEVFGTMEKYDYRQEAEEYKRDPQPGLMEVQHPKLIDLYHRLSKYLGNIAYRNDNIRESAQLSKNNLRSAIGYFNNSQDAILAGKFAQVPIEPLDNVATAFQDLGLESEATRLRNIYEFAYAIRKWRNEFRKRNGTVINVKLEYNYDEATPDELKTDKGYLTFASLFKTACNYSTSQKRALYDGLKELYTSVGPKDADKTVMAVILLFRKSKTRYKAPFSTKSITDCKEKAMEAFGRDTTVIRSYSENSLDEVPRLGRTHVKRAESIIAKALESTRSKI